MEYYIDFLQVLILTQRGRLSELLTILEKEEPRGEYVVVIAGAGREEKG